MADVKITDKIPNNVVKADFSTSNNICKVQLKDSSDHVLLTQPIRIPENKLVSTVRFNKSLNTITLVYEDTVETTIFVGNHLLLVNGDWEMVRGMECVKQQIDVGLHIMKGDWVLDSTAGIDYVGGLRAYPEILNAQIKKAINTVENVDTVLKYNFYEDDNNVYHVTGTVKSGNTELIVNSNINPKE